jgi:hypothetical protein
MLQQIQVTEDRIRGCKIIEVKALRHCLVEVGVHCAKDGELCIRLFLTLNELGSWWTMRINRQGALCSSFALVSDSKLARGTGNAKMLFGSCLIGRFDFSLGLFQFHNPSLFGLVLVLLSGTHGEGGDDKK